MILILSLSLYAKAQNLVPNGYFEIYDTCPNNISQINYALSWINADVRTSPDYYNACASASSQLNVPYTAFGYQPDCCGGGGIAGIYAFNKFYHNDGRDYIQAKLTDTLKTGHKYIATMYVSSCNDFDYAIASLGMFFTSTAVQGPSNVGFMNVPNPQVKNTSLLSDTANWMLVQDTLIAQGGEAYLTIGNFSYDALSDTTKVNSNAIFFGGAYYYIDGVSVYDVTNGACNNYWDAGYDKYILAGDSIRLGAINTDNSTYTWQNSAGGNTYLSSNTDARPWCKPAQTTTYYVTKTCPNNNVFKDTVTVYVKQYTTGVKQLVNDAKINLYPNPNNGTMLIEYNIVNDALMEISDVTGNSIANYKLSAINSKLEVKNNDLADGVYLYRIFNNNGLLKTGRIVIMK